MKAKLTDTALRSYQPRAAQYSIGDAACPGLCVRITPKGVKTFAFAYRNKTTRKVEWLTLGRYPDMALTKAREIANDARKAISREIRSWHIARRSDKSLSDLARMFNPIVQGWINYYGRFYRSELVRLLKRINEYLVRWARWKYKRLRRYPAKARKFLAAVYRREPGLFAHWRFGARPDGWTIGAG